MMEMDGDTERRMEKLKDSLFFVGVGEGLAEDIEYMEEGETEREAEKMGERMDLEPWAARTRWLGFGPFRLGVERRGREISSSTDMRGAVERRDEEEDEDVEFR